MASTARTVINHKTGYGREYIEYSDGSQWTRKLDCKTKQPVGEWAKVETAPNDNDAVIPATRHLALVTENQADGEPKHWSLFSYLPDETGRGRGQRWQATGDAQFMHFEHAADIDPMNAESFAWHQVMNSDISEVQVTRIDEIARSEPPPRAESRATVTEHCQGWSIRVLKRLAVEGMVEQTAIAMLEQRMDPI
ncbi:hypothetical protein F5144DRAFT_353082 [Chaetomium tenue]|uniref:Uncharacterized protein n=1 Tax=Chaetomium tenue TaxID=1854479 RepID=A0ACB7NZL2_9PEZI|nr:hypothetical protein F5144DRAFT_353082 [Chaetomium globosum]